MQKKNYLFLLVFAIIILMSAPGCGDSPKDPGSATSATTAPATSAPATATPIPTSDVPPLPQMPPQFVMATAYVYFGNPGIYENTTRIEYSRKVNEKGDTKKGKKHDDNKHSDTTGNNRKNGMRVIHIKPTPSQSAANRFHIGKQFRYKLDSGTQGPCGGKGICSLYPTKVDKYILATFTIQFSDPSVLYITFSMKALRESDPPASTTQYEYFSDPSKKYEFGDDFPLGDLFGAVYIPQYSWIGAYTVGDLILAADGDTMTIKVALSEGPFEF